jgi:hypothetical protein
LVVVVAVELRWSSVERERVAEKRERERERESVL